jgi:hypothetical protein
LSDSVDEVLAVASWGKSFEGKQKILSFTHMATLTRYNTFKSLKQQSSAKIKKAANRPKMVQAEMEAFVQLLSKAKV